MSLFLFLSSTTTPLFSSSSSSMLPHTQGMDCSWGSVGTVPHTMPAFLFLFSFGDSCRALFSSTTTTISTSPSSIFTFFLLLNQPSTSTFPGSPLLSFVIFTSFTLTSLSSTDLYFSFFFSLQHTYSLSVSPASPPPSSSLFEECGPARLFLLVGEGDRIPIDRGLSNGGGVEMDTVRVCVCITI